MAENIQQAVEVAVGLSLFGSLDTELAPSDLPEGLSPDNQDVVFLPGSVGSRPGLHKIYAQIAGNVLINSIKSFVQPNGDIINLVLDSSGQLWQEDVTNNPGVLTALILLNPGCYMNSSTAFGKEFMAFHDGTNPLSPPLKYNGTTISRVSQDGPGAAPTIVDSAAAGNISAGIHKFVLLFITSDGYITAPSPIGSWNAAGGKKATVSNIPVGPSNVIARIIAFTGAGGSNFFMIPATITFPSAIQSTVIPVASVTFDLDFSDNALFSSTAIDITGNNLFSEKVIRACTGIFGYASRVLYYGEYNKIENFINMGFDGGFLTGAPNTPLGWAVVTAGGAIVSTGLGLFFNITGDGTANPKGQIKQTAFQDGFGADILKPGILYSFTCFAKQGGGGVAGTIRAELQSTTAGFLATADIPINTLSPQGRIATPVAFSLALPNPVPADLILRVNTLNTANGQVVSLKDYMVIPTANLYNKNASISYVNNPETIDQVSGRLGITPDTSRIQVMFTQRDVLDLLTSVGLYETRDVAGLEPNKWSIQTINNRCGCASYMAADVGENFAMWVSSPTAQPPSGKGLYVYFGGIVYKISQEIQTLFDSINPLAQNKIWVKNDPIDRRIYIGVPLDASVTPNQILVMDYRELDTALDIANRPPLHISFTGKMICSDLSRKWTRWNIPSPCAGALKFAGGITRFCFGGGAAALSNLYYLDSTKLTDDDLGQIFSYYITYFFVNHEMEAAIQVGLHRKLFKRYDAFMSGVGNLGIVVYGNTLTNPLNSPIPRPLSLTPGADIVGGLNVRTERVAFKILAVPIAGTDSSFDIGKFIVTMQQDPIAPIRSGGLV